MELKKCKKWNKTADMAVLIDKQTNLDKFELSPEAENYLKKQIKEKKKIIRLNLFTKNLWFILTDKENDLTYTYQNARKGAYNLVKQANDAKVEKIVLVNEAYDKDIFKVFIEAVLLSNYQFLRYITQELNEKKHTLESIKVYSKEISEADLEEIKKLTEAVFLARDLVNTPYADLDSVKLAEKIKKYGKQAGFKVEVFDKKKIQSLKMGGLLAVNQGSKNPPTFSILTWKPSKAKNKKPVILVGKGVVFDSGGLNLKPTGFMEDMKIDMAGAAAVIATIYAIAVLNLPVYVIGLVPSTDNAISEKSYAPGDVLTMYNGTTVEIGNTDAEGRLILADALSYAKKYDPQLVIDLATLTGSAIRALGHPAIAMLSNTDTNTKELLIQAGNKTYERMVEFPLWREYKEMLKSDIADIKNIGGTNAGIITAAKFLETFTDYNWVHLDIAPNAYLEKEYDFRGKGATGMGVRLLTEFIRNFIINP